MRKESTMWRTSCCARLQSVPARVRTRSKTVQGGIDVSLCVGCDLSLSRLNAGTFYVGNRARL